MNRRQAKAQGAQASRRRGWAHLWIHTPQRSRLRNALFQIHLWVGVSLSLYAVVIGLSGSALVFRQELQRKLEPHLYTVAIRTSHASLQNVMNEVLADNPGYKVVSVNLPLRKEQSGYIVLASAKRKLDRSRLRMEYFNPYTGRLLGEENIIEGPFGWIANLHYFLFAGEAGLIVNGVMAVAFFILCMTGVVLWWPGVKRWTSALVFRRRSNWTRVTWDIHVVTGFWCSLGLALLAFTGVYFAFPVPVSLITILGTGGKPRQVNALLMPPHVPETVDTHTLSIDSALRLAQAALPSDSPPTLVIPPTIPAGLYTVVGYRRSALPYAQDTTLSIDARSGQVLKRVDSRQYPLGMRITQYFHALHFGDFGDSVIGIFMKIVWVLLGIASAALGITGLLMYWNRYLRKQWFRKCQSNN